MPEPLEWVRVAMAAGLVAALVVVSLFLRFSLRRLSRWAAGTRTTWDDLVVRLLCDLASILCMIGGLWIGALIVRFQPDVRTVIGQTLSAVLILTVSLATARLAAGIVGSVASARSGVERSVTIFANITRAVILVIGTLVLLQSLGVSITPMLTALGVGGLTVALALQNTLANLFAGVHILASETVEPGDVIRLSTGEEGEVVDVNWRKTTIRDIFDNLVIIPNARFADAILTNFHQPTRHMDFMLQAKVAYDSDLEAVEKVTLEVARAIMNHSPGGVPGYEPLVRFHTFGDTGVDFLVVLRTIEYNEQYPVKHAFLKALHARFRAEGIEIPLPTHNLIHRTPGAHGAGGVPVQRAGGD
ncbi:mechanosensitive ion channel family protein [Actinocorallia longicatena]|uniref:Mechanosensitive ion channel family protein n=1 Tax=Actinocorallia longicatena TaxID=111803 RepID=A0ABP6QJ22_9ACTN